MQPATRRMSLTVPPDASYAVTVRTFVATGARFLGVGEDVTEDLRLAASELFAHAVERAATAVTFTMDGEDDRVVLDLVGTPPLPDPSEPSPPDDPERLLVVNRSTVLHAIADVSTLDDGIRLTVPIR